MPKNPAVPPPVTAVLETAGTWLPDGMEEVEQALRQSSTGFGAELEAEATETLEAGGKRLRPLLVLICAGENGGSKATAAAAAVELVHMATLVHDDVLDGARLRRGRETVVARSGRQAAVSTGDFLFSRAFELLTRESGMRAVQLLARSSTALARGELAQRADAFDLDVTESRYMDRCRLKTAALFEAACLLGLESGGRRPDEEIWSELAAFGREIGLAFQLLDDVLDVTGPQERTGKARGTDLLDGTVTLPLIRARRRAAEGSLNADLAQRLHGVEPRTLQAAEAEELCDLVISTGSTEIVRADALQMVETARARLEAACFDGEQRTLLETVARGVVERYS